MSQNSLSFPSIPFFKLHEKAKALAQSFHQDQAELILILQEIDLKKAFLHLGYPSLFQYALDELNLSEANASNFICVARKTREVPELMEAIKSSEISVAKARKVSRVIQKENAKEWLKKAKDLPQRLLERDIAHVLPEKDSPTQYHYTREDRLRLELSVGEELMNRLLQIQDLLAQKRGRHVKLEEALEIMSKEYVGRHDPVERAKRRKERREKKEKKTDSSPQAKTANEKKSSAKESITDWQNRCDQEEHPENWQEASEKEIENANSRVVRHGERVFRLKPECLPKWLKEDVQFRDGHRCTYIYANGKRCKERRWLHIHHLRPRSEGGSDKLDNLKTVCSAHHRWIHRSWEIRNVAMRNSLDFRSRQHQQVLGFG